MFNVSKTYETVSPESAEQGDFEETGFVFEDRSMTLRELLRDIEWDGFTDTSCYPCDLDNFAHGRVWLTTQDEDHNYTSGHSTRYSLHIDATPRNRARLWKFLAAKYPRVFRNR